MKKLLVYLLTLTLSIPSFATVYYVKNGGNDLASGTSEAEAWATISKVNYEKGAGTFVAGDFILFNRGDTWREASLDFTNINGTLGNPITIGSYGTGYKPILKGTKVLGTFTDNTDGTWTIYDADLPADDFFTTVYIDNIPYEPEQWPYDGSYLPTSTNGSTTTVIDNTQSWTTNQWNKSAVQSKGVNWASQVIWVASNTSTTITTDPVFDASLASKITPADTSRWGQSGNNDTVIANRIEFPAVTNGYIQGAIQETSELHLTNGGSDIALKDYLGISITSLGYINLDPGGSAYTFYNIGATFSNTLRLQGGLRLDYAANGQNQWPKITADGTVVGDSLINAGFALKMKIDGPIKRVYDQVDGEIAWYDEEGKHYTLQGSTPQQAIQRLMASDEITLRHVANNRVLIYLIFIMYVGIILIQIIIIKKGLKCTE